MSQEVQFDLPWPPSINKMYYNNQSMSGRGRRLTQEATVYKRLATEIIYYSTVGIKFGKSKVSIKIIQFHPFTKQRDRDNGLKIVFDSIEQAAIIENDNQIRNYQIIEGPRQKDGLWKVWMKPCSKDIKFAKFEEFLGTLDLEE